MATEVRAPEPVVPPKAFWLQRTPLYLLVALFGLGLLLIGYRARQLAVDLVHANSIESSGQYAAMLRTFRALYSAEVIARLRGHGVHIGHDYREHEPGVPLPATLTLLLGERLGNRPGDVGVRLYSPYPFPWRDASGGLRDAFAEAAWAALNRRPDEPFVRIEPIDGVPHVRYAIADRMQQSCVGCHNQHPQSPRRGWQAGDVRGVLELTQPLAVGLAQADRVFEQVFWLTGGLLFVGLGSIAWLLLRLRREYLREQSLALELTTSNRKLDHEIKVRRRAELSLKAAKQQADTANQAKSIFLANMSHEIRTPMNVILGHAQLLARQPDLHPDLRESLEIIQRSGHHLIGLISDVIDVTRIEAGVVQLKLADFNVGELVDSVAEMFRYRAQQKSLELQVRMSLPRQPAWVHGDRGKLSQVLINLIGNAVKFTERGQVQLNVAALDADVWQFEVVDSGPGIPAAQIEQVLHPFVQTELGSRHGGAGLGLSIASRQLELMGAQLQLESELGQGTCARFRLTLATAAPPLTDAGATDLSRKVQRLAPGFRVHALVVDDARDSGELLSRLLREVGIEADCVADGTAALAHARQRIPDIVFSDIRMPQLNGYALVEQLRAQYPEQRIVLVAMSASSLDAKPEHFLAAGFDEYIAKPYRFERVFDCLRRCLHVEFIEEQSRDAATPSAAQAVDVGQLQIPPTRLKALLEQVELGQVSALEAALNALQAEGGDAARLAMTLRPLLQRYDLEALSELLAGLIDADAT